MNAGKKLTELKREAIIQAAKDEFREHGFTATNMDKVAETAKVSKRTVYNHFASKEILFEAIAKDLCNSFTTVTDHPYLPDRPVHDQLTAIANQQMEMLCSERFLRTFKMITAESLASPELTEKLNANFQVSEVGIVKWISAASRDGKLKVENPEAAGKQFIALLEAFTSWPYLWGAERVSEQPGIQAVVDSTVGMFLDHYEIRNP